MGANEQIYNEEISLGDARAIASVWADWNTNTKILKLDLRLTPLENAKINTPPLPQLEQLKLNKAQAIRGAIQTFDEWVSQIQELNPNL